MRNSIKIFLFTFIITFITALYFLNNWYEIYKNKVEYKDE